MMFYFNIGETFLQGRCKRKVELYLFLGYHDICIILFSFTEKLSYML